MCADLLPTFIRLIDRVKECNRVGHMDHHRQSKFACHFPNWIQARIVHFDQLPFMVFDMQPKRFPDLQPLRARILLDLEPASRPISKSIAHAFPLRPIHAAEDLKTLRGFRFEMIEMLIKNILAPTAIQVNVMSHTCFIEQIQ